MRGSTLCTEYIYILSYLPLGLGGICTEDEKGAAWVSWVGKVAGW